MAFTPSQVDLTTSSNNSRLTGWLASVIEVISGSNEEVELQLSHLGNENPRVVRTFRFRPDSDTDDIEGMAQTIEQVANDDAEHLPAGSQHYSVSAVTPRGREIGSLLVKITLRFRPGSLLSEIEDPSSKGLTGMAMRHSEQNQQALFAMMGAFADSIGRRQQQQDSMIERLQDKIAKDLETKEAEATRQQEREAARDERRTQADLEQLERIQRRQRLDELGAVARDTLKTLAPVLMARFLGRDGGPVPAPVFNGLAQTLASSLTDADLERLATSLRPDLLALIVELRAQYRTAAATADPSPRATSPGSAAAPAPPAGPAPTDDPYGPLPRAALQPSLSLIKKDLLPWATERIAKGEPADPSEFQPTTTLLLVRMMQSLNPDEYEAIITGKELLSVDEGRTLAAVVQQLGLGPMRTQTG